MNARTMLAAVLVLALAVSAAAIVMDDSDAASGYTADVYIEDGGSMKKLTGSGSTLQEILQSAVKSSGHTVELGSINVKSLDGEAAPEGKAWTVQQWLPPRGWEVKTFQSASATIASGTSYCIYLADATMDPSTLVTTYSSPSFEPTATGYFFIKFVEDSEANSYVTSLLTKEQRESGFWISGTGSNLAWAFKDACQKYGLQLDMSNGVKGNIVDPDYIGWLNSFLGLTDELMSGDTNTGDWKYWSQFYWSGSKWVYSQTMGHYDPGVTQYFALIRQITTKDVVSTDLGASPSSAPISKMSNGCTVKFVDGDGKTVKTQNVPYFGSATAPETATKTSTLETSYVFKGWEGSYTQVISDVTIKAQFDEVANARVTGIKVTDYKSSIPTGTTYQFKADVSPSNATQKDVTWSVSDSSVASISSDGTFKALKSGSVTVTAASVDGGYTDTVQVTVTAATDNVWSVKISGMPSSLEVGKTAALKVTIEPTGAKNKNVTWSSSDESVATVDSSGKVTAVSAGEAEITVTSEDGGHTDTVEIVVTPSSTSVWSVEIGNGDCQVQKGKTLKLVAEILPSTAKDKTVTWSVADTSIATIDKDGNITGKKFGVTTVEVRTNDGGKTATVEVKVVPGPGQASYVTIVEGDQVIEKGSVSELTANVDPSAKKKDVKWYSEDESIVTVDSKGNVTAVSPGTVRITVEVIDGGVTGSCEVRVYSMDDVSHVSEDTAEAEGEAASSEVDANRVKALADNGASYTLKTDKLGSVVLSTEILAKSSGSSIELSVKVLATTDLRDAQKAVIGDRQAFEYLVNGSDVSDLGGKATVSIPYVLRDGESAKDLKVCCVDYKGNTEEFACKYDSSTGMATFETTHFSVYFVSAEKAGGSDGGSGSGSGSAIAIAAVAIVAVLAICAIAFTRMHGRA